VDQHTTPQTCVCECVEIVCVLEEGRQGAGHTSVKEEEDVTKTKRERRECITRCVAL